MEYDQHYRERLEKLKGQIQRDKKRQGQKKKMKQFVWILITLGAAFVFFFVLASGL